MNYFEGQPRSSDGTFAKGNGGSREPAWYEKEQTGLSKVEKQRGVEVIREQKLAKVEGTERGRYYDGLVKNPDGTYTGIEVKSGGARLEREQREFDSLVSPENPATTKLNGETIKITRTHIEYVD